MGWGAAGVSPRVRVGTFPRTSVSRMQESQRTEDTDPKRLAREKPLYVVLSLLGKVWGGRRLRGFVEIQVGSCQVNRHTK